MIASWTESTRFALCNKPQHQVLPPQRPTFCHPASQYPNSLIVKTLLRSLSGPLQNGLRIPWTRRRYHKMFPSSQMHQSRLIATTERLCFTCKIPQEHLSAKHGQPRYARWHAGYSNIFATKIWHPELGVSDLILQHSISIMEWSSSSPTSRWLKTTGS